MEICLKKKSLMLMSAFIFLQNIKFCFGLEQLPTSIIVSKLIENGYLHISAPIKEDNMLLFSVKRFGKTLRVTIDPSTGAIKNEQSFGEDDPDFSSSGQRSGYIEKLLDGESDGY